MSRPPGTVYFLRARAGSRLCCVARVSHDEEADGGGGCFGLDGGCRRDGGSGREEQQERKGVHVVVGCPGASSRTEGFLGSC